jgi:hypothetical protein
VSSRSGKAHERRSSEGGIKVGVQKTLERKTLRELAGRWPAPLAEVKTQKPRLVLPYAVSGPCIRRKRNGKWVCLGGDATAPRGSVRLRKGESQGRGEYEIRLTRVQGE